MASPETYYVAADADDWYWDSVAGTITGSTTLYASHDSSVSPAIYQYAFFKIDTSALPNDATITGATFNFYGHAYTASKSTTFLYNTALTNNFTDEENFDICDENRVYSGAGWKSVPIDAGCLNYISKTGYTWFRLSVPDPGVGKYRTMQARAHEYTGAYDAYVTITYTLPGSYIPQIIILSS